MRSVALAASRFVLTRPIAHASAVSASAAIGAVATLLVTSAVSKAANAALEEERDGDDAPPAQ